MNRPTHFTKPVLMKTTDTAVTQYGLSCSNNNILSLVKILLKISFLINIWYLINPITVYKSTEKTVIVSYQVLPEDVAIDTVDFFTDLLFRIIFYFSFTIEAHSHSEVRT